jgi:hypothetical protein
MSPFIFRVHEVGDPAQPCAESGRGPRMALDPLTRRRDDRWVPRNSRTGEKSGRLPSGSRSSANQLARARILESDRADPYDRLRRAELRGAGGLTQWPHKPVAPRAWCGWPVGPPCRRNTTADRGVHKLGRAGVRGIVGQNGSSRPKQGFFFFFFFLFPLLSLFKFKLFLNFNSNSYDQIFSDGIGP